MFRSLLWRILEEKQKSLRKKELSRYSSLFEKNFVSAPFFISLSSLKGAGGSEAMEMMRHNVESLELTLQFSVIQIYLFFHLLCNAYKKFCQCHKQERFKVLVGDVWLLL